MDEENEHFNEEDAQEDEGHDEEDSPGRKGKEKKRKDTLRKAPQAPKRFKSSYICFFMSRQPEIKLALGDKATVAEISKRSAEMWKNLPADERGYWDDVAAKDKERYMHEKASYTGPWQVPWKRAKKDPSAPKRPMSAFLYFSQGKRTLLKKEHPEMKNTEVSRLLGEMWRNSSDAEKRPHIEKEKEEREKYKVAIAEWRKEADERQKTEKNKPASIPDWSAVPTIEGQPTPHLASVSEHVPHPQVMAHYDHGAYHHPPPGHHTGYMYSAPPPYAYGYAAGPYGYAPPPATAAPSGRGKQHVIPGSSVGHYHASPAYAMGEPTGYDPEDGTEAHHHGVFDFPPPDSVETTE